MANKPLQSIKFPDLPDTYTIPAVDNTLAVSGNAADAKAVGDEIGSLKTDLMTFENDSGVRYNVEFTKVTGKYIGSDNNEKSGQYFSRSVPIAVAVGDVIEFTATGYNTNVAMIALTDAEETFYKSVARSVDSTQRTYTYTCIDSGYIIVSYENRNSYSFTIKNEMSNIGLNNSVNKLYEADTLQLAVDSGIVVSVDDVTATVSQTGHYINNGGVYSASANFNMYSVSLQKGDTISFNAKGYITNVAVLARINSDGTYTPLIISEDSDEHNFVYSAPEVMNMYISSNTDTPPRYSVFSSRIDMNWVQINDLYKNKLIELSYDAEMNTIADNIAVNLLATGCYIRNDGAYQNNSGSSNFKIYGNIILPEGSKIKFNAAGYNTNIAVLARVNSDGTYTPLINSEDSNEHEFSYIALTRMTVVISSHKSVTPSYSLYASRIDENAAKIHDIDSNYVAFATIGVLGDSLASGASNYPPDGAADRKDYAWGKFIEREHGISVSLFSSGGATTRSWLAQSYGLAALQAANMLDCYIIGLGVNDAYSLGDAYLGSVSDVHVGNEDENADTYYGNYSKIIAAIKTKSPRAKIFCITNPRGTNATGIAYNEAVEDIVGLYTNTYLIDLREDSFYTSPEFKSTWYSAHSTAVGYKLIAQNIYNHLNDIIQENVKEFLDIQWIVNNHN